MSSDPEELAKMNVHCFAVGASRRIVKGKSYYPNMLRVRLDRYAAFKLIRELLVQLETNAADLDVQALFGELKEEEKE